MDVLGGSAKKMLADPRIDFRIKQMMEGKPPESPQWVEQLGSKQGLSIKTHEVVSQPDGNTIDILFIRPESQERLPCIVYFHGGAMAFGDPQGPPWSRFGRTIAQQGVCVAMPDFRNYVMPSRPGKATAKFPAGLNDCLSALEWVNGNKDSLGVGGRVLLAGESGGGNLTLALAMKCKREGKLGLFQGFYALCPYIAGSWPDRPGEPGEILGTSHMRSAPNHGLVIDLGVTGKLASRYAPQGLQQRDALAWPGFAKDEDVEGLPPGVVSVDECDPLCDEGINFYRLLLRARVRVRCVVNVGTIHGSHLLGFFATPEVTLATARSLADAARGEEALLSKL